MGILAEPPLQEGPRLERPQSLDSFSIQCPVPTITLADPCTRPGDGRHIP